MEASNLEELKVVFQRDMVGGGVNCTDGVAEEILWALIFAEIRPSPFADQVFTSLDG